MSMKFNYTMMIATDRYKDSLVGLVKPLSEVPMLKTIVVVNSRNSEEEVSKYKSVVRSSSVIFNGIPEPGKSKALNHLLRDINDPNTFILFTDDDIVVPAENIGKYISEVERLGRGFFYGGGVDVVCTTAVPEERLRFYPASIRGVSEQELPKLKLFLGCNWGAFAEDMQKAGYFNPYFGPGSITGSVGQETNMMRKLLRLGLKPSPIFNCRVTHFAPENYHTDAWLLRRKYREGINHGLLYKSDVGRTILKKVPGIFRGNPLRRKINLHFVRGLIHSLKYYFHKLN
jgi:hypothetical protein